MTFFRVLFVSGLLLSGCADGTPGNPGNALLVRSSVCAGRPLSHRTSGLTAVAPVDDATLCGAMAPDCETFLSCEGVNPDRACTFGEGHGCEGNVAVTCSEFGFMREETCEGENPECVLDALGIPHCTSGDTCADRGAYCDGNVRVECLTGVASRYPCGDFTCVEGPGTLVGDTMTESSAACVEQAQACERDRCDGDTLLRCTWGVGVTAQDCELVSTGSRCTEEDGVAACRQEVIACEEGEVRCLGDYAQACVAGGWETFPCSEFEGSRCVADEETVSCAR